MPDTSSETTDGNWPMEMVDVTVSSLRDPRRVVLESVDWKVEAGSFWAVIGLHRTGKSDLLTVAAGIMPPQRGIYRLLGHELVRGHESEHLATRLRLGMVFDGGQVFHHLTVAENVALPLCYHFEREPAQVALEVGDLLQMTGLTAYAGALPAGLGRNWQQRVGLARALAMRPEILLLDSPLSGLDPRDAEWWLDLLSALSTGHPTFDHRPITLVVTADDWRPWRDRASQFALLRSGKFIRVGGRESWSALGQEFPEMAGRAPP